MYILHVICHLFSFTAPSCIHVTEISHKVRPIYIIFRSQWSRTLRRRSAATRLLRLRGSNPVGGMDVYPLCVCVYVVRCIWDELFPRQMHPTDCRASLCVIVKTQQWPSLGCSAIGKNIYVYIIYISCSYSNKMGARWRSG